MKIRVVSDLHLEFSDVDLVNEPHADVLILSGDIMIAADLAGHGRDSPQLVSGDPNLARVGSSARRYREFLDRVSAEYPHVIWVAGNHEFYHGKFVASIQTLRDEAGYYSNVHFLERDTFELDNILFVGGTLWTDCNRCDPLTLHALSGLMNDFRIIRNDARGNVPLKPADIVERHRDTLGYVRTVLENNQDKTMVVVGHHAPSFHSVHPDYVHDQLMNGGYCTNLEQFILDHPQIKLWTHGHTHYARDYMIGSTRVVCNPRGYDAPGYYQTTGWRSDMIVEV